MNAKTLSKRKVSCRAFALCSTYSEVWNGLLHLLRRGLRRSVFCVLRESSPSLIDERFDHDSCGVGFVASVDASAFP